MKIRIDLKIFIFFVLFYLTNQIKIYLIIMFFCIIHELGHLIIGLILGMKPEILEIMPYGLAINFKVSINDLNFKIHKGNLLEIKKILVAIAGPIVSLVLVILYTYFKPFYIDRQDAIYSNMLILVFNLLPLYPLDGGRIIKGILHIFLGNKDSEKIINIVSNITMIIITFISSITIYYFKNIAVFIICVFLWIITLQENVKFRKKMKMYDILDNNCID